MPPLGSGTVFEVKAKIVAWAARTSAGTRAAAMSTYVLNPGGDVEVLVPGAAVDLFLDNLA
jgi:hypothetical protein